MYWELKRGSTLKKIGLVVAMLLLMPISQAPASAVQEFNVRAKNVKKDGRLELVISSRAYDNSGGLGPVTESVNMYFTSAAKMNPRGFPVCNLKKLKRSRNAKDCKGSIFGRGKASVDIRPLFKDPIQAKLTMFIGKKPKGRNGVMSLVILAEPISNNPLIKSAKQVLSAPIVKDSSQGPNYAYRLSLDAGIDLPPELSNITVSINSLSTTTKAKTRTKRVCKKRSGGKCVKKGKVKIPLYRLKKCPASKEIFFRADFVYAVAPPISRVVKLPCRYKFKV